jgi:hypothetical protein
MSTTEAEDYVKRAEECLRLAGACIAESNRQILIYAAVHWRMLAEEAAGTGERLRTGQSLTRQPPPQALRTTQSYRPGVGSARRADSGQGGPLGARPSLAAAGRLIPHPCYT